MNLADIRRKAQKEKEQEQEKDAEALRAPSADSLRFGHVRDDEEETSTELPALALPAQEPVPDPLRVADLPTERNGTMFDPVAVLLAGRVMASLDDGLAATGLASWVDGEKEYEEFLCFLVAGEEYAVNIMEIKEIIKPREVTEVPRTPTYVTGILSLRGTITPVFDMRLRLGHGRESYSGRERIVIVRKGNELCGILVDEVTKVVRIASSHIEPPPAVLDGVDREFVMGVGRSEGQIFILMNLERVLDVNLC